MITNPAMAAANAPIMGYMARFTDETTGKRLRWLRERKNLKQTDLAREIDVNPVYISQMENDHRPPSRRTLRLLANVLGTTMGFLECETDDPEPVNSAPEPVYFSPEADAAARLVDAADPDQRALALAILRAVMGAVAARDKAGEGVIYLPNQPPPERPMQQRLILGEYAGNERKRARS